MKRVITRSAFSAVVRPSRSILISIVAAGLAVTTASQTQSVLTHHVREVASTGEARAIGQLPTGQILNLDIVLPLSNQTELESLLSDIYDPNSGLYRHFLTVPEFTARFGPSQADYDAVIQFANKNGLMVVGVTRDGMDVQVKGPVSAVETAFHINMRTYQHPTESRTFYGPDNEPITDLSFNLWHVSGLDNYSIPHTLLVNKERLRKGTWYFSRSRRIPCHHRLGPFGFFPG